MLIDTHCHITDERYNGARDIIDNMKNDNLDKVVTIGYDLQSSEDAVRIASENENVYCAVGIHPCDAVKLTSDPFDRLLELSHHPKTVAIGEIGLDYHFGDDRELEKKWLVRQLELVQQAQLPVCFHVRDSYEDMLKIVTDNLNKIQHSGIMHCFSGSKETAKQYIDMGFYISFSGSITFKNAVKFPDIIKSLPLDRILIETDCPYLTPTPFRGQLNYPKYVRYQAMKIAEILGLEVERVEEITRQNAYNLFSKMKKTEVN